MHTITFSEEQFQTLRRVLDYVMSSEADFYQDELASFGDAAAQDCIGYHAWRLANELNISTADYNEYRLTAAELGYKEL